MSIAMQIVCDGCGKTASGGAGRNREHAHVVRTRLRAAGWAISGAPNGDLCEHCRANPGTAREAATSYLADSRPVSRRDEIRGAADVAARCTDLLDAPEERFVCFDLDNHNNVIERRLIAIGCACCGKRNSSA